MVRYRRCRLTDGTYFFTLTLRDRRSDLLTRNIAALRDSWATAKARVPHEVIACVVLPDHLHVVLTMRDGSDDYPRLWQEVKKGFTRRLRAPGSTMHSPWQSRYWEHTISGERDLAAHVDYVHINPLKHGLVSAVRDWPHSTFHRYVELGWLASDWAGGQEPGGCFGEP